VYPFLINFTVTFTEFLHLAWILLLLDARTEVNFQDHFSGNIPNNAIKLWLHQWVNPLMKPEPSGFNLPQTPLSWQPRLEHMRVGGTFQIQAITAGMTWAWLITFAHLGFFFKHIHGSLLSGSGCSCSWVWVMPEFSITCDFVISACTCELFSQRSSLIT
jgi:hypothetical protein